jgi:multiple sugar transport system ATP-binding protein
MAAIELIGVTKRYRDGTVAVRDLDLRIEDGEFMILVGPSGCGKTTTLRLIAGLETLTEGELQIGGEVVNDRTPAQRDVAMVFQSYALYPHMTVAKNMGFALKKAGVPKDEIARRVREAAEVLGIADQLHRKPAYLSGGQRQRVAMGRAIVREPTAFLLDEPLSNLDAKLRIQTRAEITRIHRHVGATTVYVTHDQIEAMTLGDRLAVMNNGVLQQLGRPSELYEQPRNLFVAGFIGAPSMNFFPGRVQDGALRLPMTELPLDDALRARLDGRGPDRPVIVGVRPEHLEDAALVHDERPGASVTAVVDVLESTGSDVYAHVALDHDEVAEAQRAVADLNPDARDQPLPTEIVARLGSATQIREGEPGTLWIDASKLHLFDASSGDRLP